MFNDRYGLTQAVLEGRKTMTRRIVKHPEEVEVNGHKYLQTEKLRYKVGEVVAVAQAYKDIMPELDFIWKGTAAWSNKMFVQASEMYYHIRITNARVERLQDISDEDCLREGIFWDYDDYPHMATKVYKYNENEEYIHPKAAFAALIDKVSGKGTWQSNPWVFVYEFELIK